MRQGGAYRDLSLRFGVPIGAMRRHRRCPPEGQALAAGPHPAYLRFKRLPEGLRSYNAGHGSYEAGVSVFRGRKWPSGAYAFDVPPASPFGGRSSLVGLLFSLISFGRPIYEAFGAEVGGGMDAGEPLLGGDVRVGAISPLAHVGMPDWAGPEARKLADDWGRWRKTEGLRGEEKIYATGSTSLFEQTARALSEADAMFGPIMPLTDEEARLRLSREVVSFWGRRAQLGRVGTATRKERRS